MSLALFENTKGAFADLARAVDGGFFCYPAMVRDPWLDPLRGRPEFKQILQKAQVLHQEALDAFTAEGENRCWVFQAARSR